MRNLRVFWPQEVTSFGFVVGWLHEETIVVADVVESKVRASFNAVKLNIHDRKDPHMLLRKSLLDNEKWQELEHGCQSQPYVLGESTAEGLSITWNGNIVTGIQSNILYYQRPSLYHMRFYSLSPLNLDITTNAKESALFDSSRDILRHEVVFETFRPIPKADDIRKIVCQLNASGLIAELLRRRAQKKERSLHRRTIHLPGPPKVVAQCMGWAVKTLMAIFGFSVSLFDSTIRLKDISATVQQFDVRLEQFSFFPSQIALISTRSRRDIAIFSAQYINFFSNIWLIFNDIAVGIAVGTMLSENHVYFGELLYTYTEIWTIKHLVTALWWLDNWPVGLKLNTNL
ncbi:phosphatidylinositol N-acetylglucosaminyltransferase subunit gpi1, partial [Serendipita sp. 399]